MAKTAYSKINLKAAAITGAVIGFLCSLFGMMMIGFGMTPMMYGFTNGAYSGYSWPSAFFLYFIIYMTVVGAIIGALIAVTYNYALEHVN